jgi:hypothetical protein
LISGSSEDVIARLRKLAPTLQNGDAIQIAPNGGVLIITSMPKIVIEVPVTISGGPLDSPAAVGPANPRGAPSGSTIVQGNGSIFSNASLLFIIRQERRRPLRGACLGHT